MYLQPSSVLYIVLGLSPAVVSGATCYPSVFRPAGVTWHRMAGLALPVLINTRMSPRSWETLHPSKQAELECEMCYWTSEVFLVFHTGAHNPHQQVSPYFHTFSWYCFGYIPPSSSLYYSEQCLKLCIASSSHVIDQGYSIGGPARNHLHPARGKSHTHASNSFCSN